MGALSRNKGRAGEQEVARLIRGHLNIDVTRNWQGPAAQGGADLTGIAGWAPEVKRAKVYSNQWWGQTLQQARDADALPALTYHIDGHGPGLPDALQWQAELMACHCIPRLEQSDCRVVMPLLAWVDGIYPREIER